MFLHSATGHFSEVGNLQIDRTDGANLDTYLKHHAEQQEREDREAAGEEEEDEEKLHHA